jgi:hypothetical protein
LILSNPFTIIGGRLSLFVKFWRTISRDPYIIQLIAYGAKINFHTLPSSSMSRPNYSLPSLDDQAEVACFIDKFLNQNIIERVLWSPSLVLSPFFLRENKDGSKRMIIDVSTINRECIKKEKFKMETFDSIVETVLPGDWFLSFDLVKGFYNVPVHQSHRKYFAFEFNGIYYQFTGLAMGGSLSPRIFTTIIKVLIGICRAAAIAIYAYLDDTLNRNKTVAIAEYSCHFVVDLFQRAGFLIHPDKSVLTPTQVILFLGFLIDSVDMTISLPTDKEAKIRKEVRWWIRAIHNATPIQIRRASAFLGYLISLLPASLYSKGHFRRIQREVDVHLQTHQRNYDAWITLTEYSLPDLFWWQSLPSPISRPIHVCLPRVYLTTDASSTGWGIVFGKEVRAGSWPPFESRHINVLELQVILYVFSSFDSTFENCHLVVSMDNQVAASYVNKLGGKKHELGILGEQIANLLQSRSSIITALYVPTDLNEADGPSRGLVPSRQSFIDSEWSLDVDVYTNLCFEFKATPMIDWFASEANSKCPSFVSFYYEPNSMTVDALLQDWTDPINYLFPPFILISRVLHKIRNDQVTAILIHPIWTGAPWWPTLLQLTIRSIDLPPPSKCLTLPNHPRTKHRLRKLKLRATLCSAHTSQ